MHQIPEKFPKEATDVLAYPLSKIINLSVKPSVFPKEYEIAYLKPLFEKGSKAHPKNYRPISHLLVVSKITEKSKHYQLQDYLKENDLHCVKSVRIRSFSGPYFPAFGLNTEICGVSLHIQSECGKMRTRKTPNTVTFHAVLLCKFIYLFIYLFIYSFIYLFIYLFELYLMLTTYS